MLNYFTSPASRDEEIFDRRQHMLAYHLHYGASSVNYCNHSFPTVVLGKIIESDMVKFGKNQTQWGFSIIDRKCIW